MSRRGFTPEEVDRIGKAYDQQVRDLRQTVREYDREIDALSASHSPYPDSEAMRPGNAGSSVRFWCEVCRSPWPCRTLNSLRAIYARVHDCDRALYPLPPLEMSTTHPAPTGEGETDERSAR